MGILISRGDPTLPIWWNLHGTIFIPYLSKQGPNTTPSLTREDVSSTTWHPQGYCLDICIISSAPRVFSPLQSSQALETTLDLKFSPISDISGRCWFPWEKVPFSNRLLHLAHIKKEILVLVNDWRGSETKEHYENHYPGDGVPCPSSSGHRNGWLRRAGIKSGRLIAAF